MRVPLLVSVAMVASLAVASPAVAGEDPLAAATAQFEGQASVLLESVGPADVELFPALGNRAAYLLLSDELDAFGLDLESDELAITAVEAIAQGKIGAVWWFVRT